MSKEKIMIVEDEVITAMSMQSKLNRMGYETCKLVSSGEDAIKNVEHEKPDLVLMDIILDGEINGIEAAREIRTRYGIPIIFVTGCEDIGAKELAEDIEHFGYLIKPVKLNDLKSAVEMALQRHDKD